MALPVVFRRRVGRDLAGAYGWYEQQRIGLGEQFLAAVNASFDAIEQFSEMFSPVHGDVRAPSCPGFRMLFSIVSNPGRSWYSLSFIQLVIPNCGPSPGKRPANKPLVHATRTLTPRWDAAPPSCARGSNRKRCRCRRRTRTPAARAVR